ncbi:hypothetical protein NQZ68_025949, partial [Dissostichus eleginoides]
MAAQTAAAAPSSPESSIQYSREFLLDKDITTNHTIDATLAEVLIGLGIRSPSPSSATPKLDRRRRRQCERKQKRGSPHRPAIRSILMANCRNLATGGWATRELVLGRIWPAGRHLNRPGVETS